MLGFFEGVELKLDIVAILFFDFLWLLLLGGFIEEGFGDDVGLLLFSVMKGLGIFIFWLLLFSS